VVCGSVSGNGAGRQERHAELQGTRTVFFGSRQALGALGRAPPRLTSHSEHHHRTVTEAQGTSAGYARLSREEAAEPSPIDVDLVKLGETAKQRASSLGPW